MAVLFVARSTIISTWASDIGQGKHVFKLGLARDLAAAKSAVTAGWAGAGDWRLVASRDTEIADEATAIANLARKERLIEPDYFPRIKGAAGVFRIQLGHVQNSLLIASAMSPDEPLADIKVKPKDIAEYMMRNALG